MLPLKLATAAYEFTFIGDGSGFGTYGLIGPDVTAMVDKSRQNFIVRDGRRKRASWTHRLVTA